MTTRPDDATTIYLVDSNQEFADWLRVVAHSVGLRVEHYTSPLEFLAECAPGNQQGCIIADLRLPEMSGLELFKKLSERGVVAPVLIITAHAEVDAAVDALKAGVADFIQKPISEQALLDRVQSALRVAADRETILGEVREIRERMVTLSPRETEVLDLLLAGKNTKQISASLGIALTTVDFHRKNVLEKMQVDNLVELVQLVDRYNELQRSFSG